MAVRESTTSVLVRCHLRVLFIHSSLIYRGTKAGGMRRSHEVNIEQRGDIILTFVKLF